MTDTNINHHQPTYINSRRCCCNAALAAKDFSCGEVSDACSGRISSWCLATIHPSSRGDSVALNLCIRMSPTDAKFSHRWPETVFLADLESIVNISTEIEEFRGKVKGTVVFAKARSTSPKFHLFAYLSSTVRCHTQLRATCLEERHVHRLSNPVHRQPTECIPQTCRKGGVN